MGSVLVTQGMDLLHVNMPCAEMMESVVETVNAPTASTVLVTTASMDGFVSSIIVGRSAINVTDTVSA